MEQQISFLLDDLSLAPHAVSDAPIWIDASIDAEVAAIWGLPLRQRVRVELRNHSLRIAVGRLELVQLPELPFDAHQTVSLAIGQDKFSSRQIIAWVLLD
jgi:hypothetical protein